METLEVKYIEDWSGVDKKCNVLNIFVTDSA
jgi:hypothetical protein